MLVSCRGALDQLPSEVPVISSIVIGRLYRMMHVDGDIAPTRAGAEDLADIICVELAEHITTNVWRHVGRYALDVQVSSFDDAPKARRPRNYHRPCDPESFKYGVEFRSHVPTEGGVDELEDLLATNVA